MSLSLSELKEIENFCIQGTHLGSYIDVDWQSANDYNLVLLAANRNVLAELNSRLVRWMQAEGLVSLEFDEHSEFIKGECDFDAEGILPGIQTRIQNLEPLVPVVIV